MAQEIEFAAIPNTQPIAYPSAIALILGEVARSSPTPKALREFLRMRNLFDKAGFGPLMAFLDVQVFAAVPGCITKSHLGLSLCMAPSKSNWTTVTECSRWPSRQRRGHGV